MFDFIFHSRNVSLICLFVLYLPDMLCCLGKQALIFVVSCIPGTSLISNIYNIFSISH